MYMSYSDMTYAWFDVTREWLLCLLTRRDVLGCACV